MKQLILVDAEKQFRLKMKKLLTDYCPEIQIAGEAEDIPSAVRLIKQLNPDIVLTSIQLEKGTAFDLLNKFSAPRFQVILTAFCGDFALKAFKYNVVDYLLKPVDPDELVKAIEKVLVMKKPSIPEPVEGKNRIQARLSDKVALTTTNGLAFVKLEKVVYLRSEGSYTTFFLEDGKQLTVCRGLKEFEAGLPEGHFYRTHQSYIVNTERVEEISKKDGCFALMQGGIEIPVSRRKREPFLGFLQGRMVG
ncbi:MAG: DNA-binding response regulator [Bacteroidetes bacterium]|nr:MAG: DNA-binding response regulator [Bacteroidota bacterium]